MSRHVYLSPEAWLAVGNAFGEERGAKGEPSRSDFVRIDLDTILFVFGEVWDLLDPWQGHPTYRGLYIPARLAMYRVVGQQDVDDPIMIVEFLVDLDYWETIASDPDE